MQEHTPAQIDGPNEKPCLVSTQRGFSLSYKGKFLYSKYAPDKAVKGVIDSLVILPGSLILALSPSLWYGLDSLLEKLSEDSFILGIEMDKNLHDFAQKELNKIKKEKNWPRLEKVLLLPFSENDYIVNLLSGEKTCPQLNLPELYSLRRVLPLEMSGGCQFSKEKYFSAALACQNTVASFWKNRMTLTKFGRLYSRNIFKNLTRLPQSIKLESLFHTIDRPILIFGGGESIEKTVEALPKEELEKCFILCVDAAAPALKERKIRIDAVCAVEGQVAIEKAYIGGGAKNSILIADMCSRREVTFHTDRPLTYFASKYIQADFLNKLSQKNYFPPFIPPLGSVGLTATCLALLLRKDFNTPLFISGLDFSYSLGRTHTKNTPAHIARLIKTDRFTPVENYPAAFKTGAKILKGKNNIPVFTDTGLEAYSKSFIDAFRNLPNIYDCGQQGIDLGLSLLSPEKLSAYLKSLENKTFNTEQYLNEKAENEKSKEEILAFLEEEEKALNRIKELLVHGKDVESCSMTLEEELKKLIGAREYLYLHFPDGYKCNVKDLSFLKRVRSQLDFFLKDIKQGIKFLSE
ncbi:MAG: DUF115 domain-containing protein [Treponema sp.]|nr:DUF115 domain-containing protein [Treponema sp.]